MKFTAHGWSQSALEFVNEKVSLAAPETPPANVDTCKLKKEMVHNS